MTKHFPHSIGCAGYRGVRNPLDEESCDCGTTIRRLTYENDNLRSGIEMLMEFINSDADAEDEKILAQVKRKTNV